jgi:hypothetical protein
MARNYLVFLFCVGCVAGLGSPAWADPAPKRACYSASDTREEIAEHHLMEPFAVLKSAASAVKAEALSAKLCRTGDDYVYEIALLHRDGRLVHEVLNASTGKRLPPRAAVKDVK